MERAASVARFRALVRRHDRRRWSRVSRAGGIRTIDVNEDPNGPRLESEVAYEVLGAGEPVAPAERMVVVLSGEPGAALDPAFQANVHQLVAELTAARATVDGAEGPAFERVIDPFVLPAAQAAGVVSPDSSTVQVVGNIPGERDVVEQKLVPVPAIVDAARAGRPARASTSSATRSSTGTSTS